MITSSPSCRNLRSSPVGRTIGSAPRRVSSSRLPCDCGSGPDTVPLAECLKDTLVRVLPYWDDEIVPDLRAGRVVLVAAHGNSLRAIVKHLDGISDSDIMDLNIPTGNPLVYELDGDLGPISSRYLSDELTAQGG